MTKTNLIFLAGGVFLLILASTLLSAPQLRSEPTEEAPGLITGEPLGEGPLVDAWGDPKSGTNAGSPLGKQNQTTPTGV